MKKLAKAEKRFENLLKALDMAKDALRNGLGPANNNSDKTFVVIPGKIEDDKVYYAIIAEKNGNGCKPVDWYSWSPKSNSKHDFLSGFGGYHNCSYDEFIKANPWVKDEWDSLKK